MTIPEELEKKIIRKYFAESWKVGTIATQLDVHHTTVERVLDTVGVPKADRGERPSIADPFLPFIKDTLSRYPTLTAARLYDMVKLRGYPGTSDGHFRRIVARLRPRKPAEAFLRLRTLPGEQAQVDWGHFGKMTIGRATRALMAFVMVLSFSRAIFLRFYVNQKLASFLQGHVAAFEYFEGVPRVALYDNPKTVVLERVGDAIRLHPTLLDCAGHYRYEPRPVAVARGNEKGRVERAIRYVRQNFWPARRFTDLDDLNDQALEWCRTTAASRRWPEDHSRSVGEVLLEERDKLLALPEDRFPVEERHEVNVGRTPYVRFDLNDYSIPHTLVRRSVTVLATEQRVRVLDGTELVADHQRSYDKGDQVENPDHINALVAQKAAARHSRGIDRLKAAVPKSHDFLVAAVEHGYQLGGLTSALLRLLDQWGAADLEAAIEEALERGVPHSHAVRQALERRLQERQAPPPIAVALPDDPKVRGLAVRPHDLSDYDITEEADDGDQETA